MSGDGDDLLRVKEEVVEGGGVTMEDLEVFAEVKEELGGDEDCIGEAMRDFLFRREGAAAGASGHGGLVPGVETLPGGRVPELLGFSEREIIQVLPSRVLGPFVPYLGEAGATVGRGRGQLRAVGRGRGGVGLQPTARGRLRRPSQSLYERRRKRRRPVFGSGRPIRLLSNINQVPENRSLRMTRFDSTRPVAAVSRRRGSISLFGEGHYYRPVSWHRQQYNESSEGFGKTGRYHPEDARLKTTGIFDAICEDLELYKIPPACWPEPLTFSDFYKSSSSSDDSGLSGSLCFNYICSIV